MKKASVQAVILAAGKGSRFRSGRSKLVEPICGQPLIIYATKLFEKLSIPMNIVLGFQADEIKKLITDEHATDTVTFSYQAEQKGTGNAVACSQDAWIADNILVMNGDMPLVPEHIINHLIEQHIDTDAAVSFVTSHNADPSIQSYGRVIKDDTSIKIVEAKDFVGDPHEHCCVNAGIYLFKRSFLQEHIDRLSANNAAQELYLTDLIKIASDHNHGVQTVSAKFDTIRGVNTYQELWAAEQIKRSELISYLMDNGVRFCAPHTVHLDLHVTIEAGTTIGNGVRITNGSIIGKNCDIEPFCLIDNATIEENTHVKSHSVIAHSIIKHNSVVGPFAHVHAQSIVETESAIGNFVEVKRSTLGSKTKAKHLTYIGDATVGNQVNIGAGTIVCNYDGVQKHKTIINDNAFIGSNNTLIAPLEIGTGAYTAGGSVINHDVPAHALAIGRAQQVIKEGYAEKFKKKTVTQHKPDDENKDHKISFIAAMKVHETSGI